MSRAEQIRAIHDAHDRFLESGAVSARVRDVVAESWRRCAADGVDAEGAAAPVAVRTDELGDYREAHPLSHVFPLLYDVLGRAAEECDAVMAVGDAAGRLLWVCGRPDVLSQAEQINFAEGAAWDEAHAGTNAPGTALRLDAPVQILASEHFRRTVQQWTCAAAPIHDPISHAILGVVDVTGGDETATPQTLAMVRAAARMAEAELGRLAASGHLWIPQGRPSAAALGRPDCQLEIGGRTSRLSLRHSEIVVLLADRPEGLTGDQLAVELYPSDVSTSTMRAELTRLRGLLGPLVESRPYRLVGDLDCDWLRVRAALDAGRVAEAVRAYRGPLLPQSEAPGVIEHRDRLERQLRSALLASRDIDLMGTWTRSRWGADDLQMWQRQAAELPDSSPVRALAIAETQRLNQELGLPLR
ncbi:GAF domain-containing protein [Jatrophihabitans sp.]|uniref:GAF domain-containing protein n=1 Tax=Jatrophihabitans sp. TaxID=1932789 RepID=UPI0030C66AF6|nr:putative phytochrome sensor protein [Jatrophihabitans sp.]